MPCSNLARKLTLSRRIRYVSTIRSTNVELLSVGPTDLRSELKLLTFGGYATSSLRNTPAKKKWVCTYIRI